MAIAARSRLWVFGSHMFGLDGAQPALVAELHRRGVRLLMERRQGLDGRLPPRVSHRSVNRAEERRSAALTVDFGLTSFLGSVGQVAEWLKAPVSKTGIPFTRYREFESLPVRSFASSMIDVGARRGSRRRC
jgi:hypothetical protein